MDFQIPCFPCALATQLLSCDFNPEDNSHLISQVIFIAMIAQQK